VNITAGAALGCPKLGQTLTMASMLAAAYFAVSYPEVGHGAAFATVVSNTVTYFVFAVLGRAMSGFVRRFGTDADAARESAVEAGRQVELERHRRLLHDPATLLRYLADPHLDPRVADAVRTQALAEANRIRAYLTKSTDLSTADLGADGDQVLLTHAVRTATTGFTDLPIQLLLDLADGVAVNREAGDALSAATATALLNVRRHAGPGANVIVHADHGSRARVGTCHPRRWLRVRFIHDATRLRAHARGPARTGRAPDLQPRALPTGRGNHDHNPRSNHMTAADPVRDNARIRVASVDDDTVIRDGLPLLLPGIEFAGRFAEVDGLLAAHPVVDVVLLDLVLRGTGEPRVLQGAAAIHALVDAGYNVLIYTNEYRREVLVVCLAAGASGVVHKAELMPELEYAIKAVANGEIVITTALVGLAELAERRGELPTLTPRQRQILSARARGEQFQSIADRLFITRKTAEEHMSVVTTKFSDYLRDHSPADLERQLGIAPGDVLDLDHG
jgi:two-component system nitrate/nitrite response regulator NarL